MWKLDRAWKRPAPTRRQQLIDVWVGLGVAALAMLSLDLYRSAFGVEMNRPEWVLFALVGLTGLVLVGRRTFPLTVLLIESVLFIVIGERQPVLIAVFTLQMSMFATLYAAWAWSRKTTALYWATAAVLVAMFGWLVWQFVNDVPDDLPEAPGLLSPYWASVVYSLALNVVYFFGAIAWGYLAWRGARQRTEIEQQRERERAVQEREREGALRAERVRIARDLHDVVAHHVSGIGVQAAGAARVLNTKPDVARDALGTIETSSRTAVSQMHQLVGLLRDDMPGGDRTSQPGLDQLHELATNDSRPAISFQQVGSPFDVSATIQLSLVRIAQEAVANIRRHAKSADHASVTLRYIEGEARAVEVEVLDNGRITAPDDSQGGFGLGGIRERAALHGGDCEIGQRPDGGFRVRVRVPVE